MVMDLTHTTGMTVSQDDSSLMSAGEAGEDGFHGLSSLAGPLLKGGTLTARFWPSTRATGAVVREIALTIVRPDSMDDQRNKAWATCSAKSRFGGIGSSSPRAGQTEAGYQDDLARIMVWNTRLRWGSEVRLTTLEAAQAVEHCMDSAPRRLRRQALRPRPALSVAAAAADSPSSAQSTARSSFASCRTPSRRAGVR